MPAEPPARLAPAQLWWRLEMACPSELEESLLWKLPALGIPRLAIRHRPQTPGERTLQAWLPESDWPEPQRAALERELASLGEPFGLTLPPLHWECQPEEDWSLSWKRHWHADPVGRRLLILPAWLELPPEHADRLVIRIDPGSAFGTGSHPTTRLCLEALEAVAAERAASSAGAPHSLEGLQVADLGCGSGILGLAALRLGAAAVAATDIDPLAVRATGANALLNRYAVTELSAEANPETGQPMGVAPFTVAQGSLDTLARMLQGRPAALLLCNILAPVIEALCPGFERLLAPDGRGLLSGLLVEQAPALTRALAAAGWRAELSACAGPWGLLTIRKVP